MDFLAIPTDSYPFKFAARWVMEKKNSVSQSLGPVPGGVGPMTIVSLLYNTLQAKKRK